MKFKPFLLILVLFYTSSNVYTQVAADPFDFFYTDLAVWEASGIINNLPPARPYPLQLVKEILTTVIEQGDSTQRRIAESHYKRFFGRILTYGGKSEAAIDTANSFREMGIAISADINYEMEEIVTLSASIDGWATNKLFHQEVVPTWQNSDKDLTEDNARVGPFWILPSINSSISLGTDEYYLNAGLMRGSFGPFPENGVVVGQQALHSGQYSFVVNKPLWGINVSIYSLAATSADEPETFLPNKFLAVHSLEYRPFNWFSIALLESVMYGNRFELMYLLPLSPYMISQGVTGLMDNSYLGGMFTVKPLEGLKIDGVLYADDLSFNDIARLNFDTKWRLAGQLGATYAPKKSGIFTLAALDYTMVMPYTYAHYESKDLISAAPNYQNYLHAGSSFGAALDPNSDRINLKIKLRPLEGIDLDLIGILIRHGNVNEDISLKYQEKYVRGDYDYITDGSILNTVRIVNGGYIFQDSTAFLTQDTLQYIWQTGFDALCRLPVLKTGGYMVFRFGYRFEYNLNDGINNNVYTYDPLADATNFADIAAEQLEAWKKEAGGAVINNYISAGFEYHY